MSLLRKWKVRSEQEKARRSSHDCQGYNHCMIYILRDKATSGQVVEMLKEYESMIKIVVDIRRRILTGGGEMQADCESLLLNDGSEQDDLWGANWYPAEQEIVFDSLINIRPRLGNRSTLIQSEERRQQIASVASEILGGVYAAE
jgi:hypothetical protein